MTSLTVFAAVHEFLSGPFRQMLRRKPMSASGAMRTCLALPGNHNRMSAGNPGAAVEALCKSLMPKWRRGAVWRRERTAQQAGYLATVQEALSGNRWVASSTKLVQASETRRVWMSARLPSFERRKRSAARGSALILKT